MFSEPIQGILFYIDIFDLVFFDYVSLVQDFDCIFLQRCSVRCSQYLDPGYRLEKARFARGNITGKSRRATYSAVASLTQCASKVKILHTFLNYSLHNIAVSINFPVDLGCGALLLPFVAAREWSVFMELVHTPGIICRPTVRIAIAMEGVRT